MKKTKWWWSIFWWGFQVLLVNSYLCYKKYMESVGTKKSDIKSHYEFQKEVALSWMDPELYWPNRYYKKNTRSEDHRATKKRKRNTVDVRSSERISSIIRTETRNQFVTNNTIVGPLRVRLDHTLPHWCEPVPTTVAEYPN